MNSLDRVDVYQLINKFSLVGVSVVPLHLAMFELSLRNLKSVAIDISCSQKTYDLGAIRVSCPKPFDCVDIVPERVQLEGGQVECLAPLSSSPTGSGVARLSGGPHFCSPASCIVLAVGLNSVKGWACHLCKVAKRTGENHRYVVKYFECCVRVNAQLCQ